MCMCVYICVCVCVCMCMLYASTYACMCVRYDEPGLLRGVQKRLGLTIESLDEFLTRTPGGIAALSAYGQVRTYACVVHVYARVRVCSSMHMRMRVHMREQHAHAHARRAASLPSPPTGNMCWALCMRMYDAHWQHVHAHVRRPLAGKGRRAQ